jgi:pimeloyl-ACP methyl ester carboxylesterase
MLLRLYTVATALYLMLTGARRRRLQVGDISLVYFHLRSRARWRTSRSSRRRAAPAEPWLLLHGLGSVAATWGTVLRKLALDCEVVVPELSALGGTRSPLAALTPTEAGPLLARLIEEVFDGRPVTVAGLSMGAWIAVRLALSRPDLVGRLVLIDAAGYRHQDWERIDRLVRVSDLAGVDRLYSALFNTTPWLLRLSRAGFLRAYTSPSVVNLLGALDETDTYHKRDLARLRMPVALVWGEHDGLFTLGTARDMAAAIPGSRLYVLPACGHAVHLECPRKLIGALEQVRRDQPASNGSAASPAAAAACAAET